jgi:hypothetical protein
MIALIFIYSEVPALRVSEKAYHAENTDTIIL